MSASGMPSPGVEYLRAEDLVVGNVFKEFDLQVKEVFPPGHSRSADGKPIDKPVLTFANAKKRMILGKVNRRLITYATGTSEPTEWVGAKIRLRVCILPQCLGQTNVATLRLALPETATKPFIAKKDYGMVATGMAMSREQAAIKAELAKSDSKPAKPSTPTTTTTTPASTELQ